MPFYNYNETYLVLNITINKIRHSLVANRVFSDDMDKMKMTLSDSRTN